MNPMLTTHKLTRSQELLEQAKKLIPGCSQTFSKAPTQYVQGVSPVFLERGQGSHVWDVDGNEYIDYPSALGAIILGHNDPDTNAAVLRQIQDGTVFSLPHPLEVELSSMLNKIIPCAEMVRFGKNGSDATSGAIRAARAHTGRDKIACCGYHGWQDWYIATTTRNQGIPKAVRDLTLTFAYNDISSLEKLFQENPGEIACVILEPIGVIEPQGDFLRRVAEITKANGALLIFDEVVTGLRLALGGAQEYFGITPDLACFGKAMANGYPISAIVGRREIMQTFEEVFFSFTFGGEAVSLAASLATIRKFRSQEVLPKLWRQGKKIQDGYNTIAKELDMQNHTQCIGLPPRTVVTFKDKQGGESLLLRSLFQQEMVKRGILFLNGFNICYSLSDEDVAQTLDACQQSLRKLRFALDHDNAGSLLEGPPVQPVFRKP